MPPYSGNKTVRRLYGIMGGIKARCNRKATLAYRWYGARGIKCNMDIGELCMLWVRDEAWKLKRPSVDRVDNDGDYDRFNCRFIELSENVRKGNKTMAQVYREAEAARAEALKKSRMAARAKRIDRARKAGEAKGKKK